MPAASYDTPTYRYVQEREDMAQQKLKKYGGQNLHSVLVALGGQGGARFGSSIHLPDEVNEGR